MEVTQEYRMSKYQDYGPLEENRHIHLVRNTENGKLCVRKEYDYVQEPIIKYRKQNPCEYFAEVLEYFVIGSKVFAIEEYIEGVNLEEYMMGKALSQDVAVYIARQIGLALQFLHHAKPMIIYRDLKPENVMVMESGAIKLIDFDISRQYQKGKKKDTVLLGTAEYAAPEQFGYYQTDNRTDIYAFGVLFNYMLTGKRITEAITDGKYHKMIRICTELEPTNRFQTIEAALKALGRPKNISRPAFDSKKSWALPGFRTKIWWKMILAIGGYASIILGTFMYTGGGTTVEKWIERFFMIGFQIVFILLSHNYRGVVKYNRLMLHRNVIIRVLTRIVLWFLLVSVALFFIIFTEHELGIN